MTPLTPAGHAIQARTVDRGALADERRILTSGVATTESGQEGTALGGDQPGRPPASPSALIDKASKPEEGA
jgi:hypothetical protein